MILAFGFFILLQETHISPPPSISDLIGQSSYVLAPIAKSGTIIIIHEKKGKPFLVTAGAYIDAPAEVAYRIISNFENYDSFVPTVKKIKPVKELSEGRRIWEYNIFLKVSILQIKLKYYIEHHYEKAPTRIWWHSVEGYESDIDEVIGAWDIIPVGREGCLIFYSVWSNLKKASFFVNIILKISPEIEPTMHAAVATTFVGVMKKKIYNAYLKIK